MRSIKKDLSLALLLAVLVSVLWTPAPALAHGWRHAFHSGPKLLADDAPRGPKGGQNDGGSRRDAGNTFEEATKIKAKGAYGGRLDSAGGDTDDFYKFKLKEGATVSVLIEFEAESVDPITLMDPDGDVIDVAMRVQDRAVTPNNAFTGATDEVRLSVHRALSAGDYRLHLQADQFDLGEYEMCFMNCEPFLDAPQELIFGGSLEQEDARVLLVPPVHGDLGNPTGPTVLDYIDATLRGIHGWETQLRKFAKDYPEYGYLKGIDVHIEIFDEADPVDPAGYDVILGYVAAGPAFRGVAGDTNTKEFVNGILEQVGLGDVHYGGRVIALSLFGASPRAGQVVWDFPEVTDLEIVTLHEFGHTFGLGHTRTWTKKYGFDLMNSPAPFIYGDGWALGKGPEHTKLRCLSSLNLYGMAVLYRWLPQGEWEGSDGTVTLPAGMPYRWYC